MARLPYVNEDDVPSLAPSITTSGEDRHPLETTHPIESLPEAYRHLQRSNVRNVLRAIGNNAELLVAMRQYVQTLWNEGGIDAREREIIVLTVTRDLEWEYLWHQHVLTALMEGFTTEEILAVSRADVGSMEDRHAALLEYTLKFLHREVDDAAHAALAEYFSDAAIVGIGLNIAFFLGLVHAQEAFDLDLEEPFVGFELENVEPSDDDGAM